MAAFTPPSDAITDIAARPSAGTVSTSQIAPTTQARMRLPFDAFARGGVPPTPIDVSVEGM
jgi:hypothetical protein